MAKCVCRFGLGLFFVLTVFGSTALAEQVWSPWYNSSPGHSDSVENETLDRIAQTHSLPCPRSRVVGVQCRVSGSGDNGTFSRQFRHSDNVLHVPCNLTGLLCRLHDQILAGASPCHDYEVRVLCWLEDSQGQRPGDKASDDTSSDGGLGANGGFTAMVAGGSVVIPLTCVLVFQLRRYKREERQRQRARRAAEDLARGQAPASLADAPPTYEELFGRQEPVSTISSGVLDGTNEAGRGSERLLSSYTERLEGRENPGLSVHLPRHSLAAPSSGPERTSVSSSSSPSSVSSPTSSVSSSVSSLSSSTVPAVGNGSSDVVQPPQSNGSSSDDASSASYFTEGRGSVTLSTISSTASTDALVPPGTLRSDVTHPGPPPAYDWPASAHVTIVVPEGRGTSSYANSTSSSSSGVVTVQPTSSRAGGPGGRRFLGMHLSIFELMAAIYPDPASTPPPSYDDALKILEASTKQTQVQII